MSYETVIGLEVHAQLKTKSKLFSGSATRFGAAPNSQTSFIDAALPGTLPTLNRQAVIMAIQFGLAVNATINPRSIFARKNYFYPDLPKGYQISQHEHPIVADGKLDIELGNGDIKIIAIARAHLEEDAGKSVHDAHHTYTGIDLNRAGTPLLEIVTEPCLYSSEEAIAYLKTIHQLLKFLGICDGNMQEGSFRCDVNISLRPTGSTTLGTRTELKNLNSFRFIEKAIAYEEARHADLLSQGTQITQETRLFCPDREITVLMRSKENENDYRYFPDPDLPPVCIDVALLHEAKTSMPALPQAIKESLKSTAHLANDDIQFLLNNKATYDYFMAVKHQCLADEKILVNWLKGTYSRALNDNALSFENPPIKASDLATLLNALADKTISNSMAKDIFQELWQTKTPIADILAKDSFKPLDNDTLLINLVESLITNFPEQVNEYRAGKVQLLGFFVGKIMKETQGKADPPRVSKLLKEHLEQKK